jgi:peptide/nickel transport system substrate-binding protein
MTYVFQLRLGVRFHNGRLVSPNDIRWSIEYGQDSRNSATGRADIAVIDKAEVEEPDRIRIRLKSPYSPFLSAVSSIQVLPVLLKESIQPGDLTPDSFPPGTGPFRFVSWRAGQELKVARFDDYWQKGLPYVDEVRFLIVSDETARMNAVRAGDLDMAEEISREQMVRIRERKVPGIGLAMAEGASYPRLGINHCRPPFQDRRVRQAFAYALNKQEIVDGVFSGMGQTTNQRFLRRSKWFIVEVPDRTQDVVRARDLLAEAGYPDGLKVTLSGPSGAEKELQVIQSMVRKAGIEATILMRDYAAHRAATIKRDFQISMSGGATAFDPDLAYYGVFHTPRVGQERSGRSQPCYTNPRVDELLDAARKTTDFQQRRSLYKEMLEILQEDVADIPIAFVPSGFAFQPHVRDFEPPITDAFSYGSGGLLKTWISK